MKKLLLSVIVSVLLLYRVDAQISQPLYDYGSVYFSQAERHFSFGFLKLADLDMQYVLDNFPDAPVADRNEMLRAEFDIKSNNRILAEKRLSEFVKLSKYSPFRSMAAYKAGVINYQNGNKPQAEYYFDLATKLANEDMLLRRKNVYKEIASRSTYWNAASKAAQGKYSDAKPLFEKCSKDYASESFADDAIYALGLIAELEGNYEEAIAHFKRVRISYPNANTYLASIIREANNNLLLRKPEQALLNLEKAESVLIDLNNEEVQSQYTKQDAVEFARQEIFYLRGEASNLAGNFQKGLDYFVAFLETFSSDELAPSAKLGAGWSNLNLTRYQEALKYYDEVILSDQADSKSIAFASMYRAVCLKKMGNIEQARREFAALSSQSSYPFQGNVLLELGQIYYEDEDYMAARKTLERAEKEAFTPLITVRVLLLLGASYVELDMWDKAISTYQKAERLAIQSEARVMPGKDRLIAESRLKMGIAQVSSGRAADAVSTLSSFLGISEVNFRRDEGQFWLAEAYYRSDLLQNAINIYENLLRDFPDTERKEETLYSLGWAYFRKQDFSKSSKTFDKLVKDFPKTKFSAEVFARQGDGYYLLKQYANAAESYRKANRLAPKTEDGQYAAYQLSHSLYRLGKYDDAIGSLLDFVRNYSKSAYAANSLYLIGWIKFQQKKYNEAIDNFNYLIEAYPQSIYIARTYYAIADAYYNAGNYEKASETYKHLIDNFPTSELAPEAMKGVQQCLILLGREDEAVEIINKYTERNEDSPFVRDFQSKKAGILFDNRKYADAINEYEKIINKNPDNSGNAESMYWIGKSYVSMNNPKEAEATFSKLYQKFPTTEYAGLALLENGLLQKKITNIKAADSLWGLLMEKYPEHNVAPQAGFERAVVKYAMTDTAGALNIYYKVANTYPETEYGVESRIRIAIYLKNNNMADSAINEFSILANQTLNKEIAAESQYRIGEIHIKAKRYEQSIEAFEIVKEKFSGYEDWFSLSLLNQGEAFEQLKMLDEARQVYSALIELRESDDFGKTAKQRLKRLK